PGPLRRADQGFQGGAGRGAVGAPARRGAGLGHGRRHQLQQRLGRARRPGRRDQEPAEGPLLSRPQPLPHRRQRRLRDRVEGGQRGPQREARRPGGDPLRGVEPGRSRRQVGRRSDVRPELSWDAAAAYMLVGATAYRMLGAWPPHTVRPGDVVLVWGGAGGLGCQAIQIARAMGGVPVAVVSSDDKIEFCTRLGAKGCINRKKFSHWGMPPHWKDTERYGEWLKGARAFGAALWEVVGERRSPRIVFEHPGEDTVPTSIF